MIGYHKKEDEANSVYRGRDYERPSCLSYSAKLAIVLTACAGVIFGTSYKVIQSMPSTTPEAPQQQGRRKADTTPVRTLDDIKDAAAETRAAPPYAPKKDDALTQK